jgi:hypothetical protein
MFDMLLAECGDSSETAPVVGAARGRREKVLEKIERRLHTTQEPMSTLGRPLV